MKRWLFVASVAMTLSCSGGGGDGSLASGGIGGSGISNGPITGIGSFYVTGTEWTVGAGGVVTVDGQPSTENDLVLGMVVTVQGERSSDGLQGTASEVVYDPDVEGVVESLVPMLGDPLDAADDEVLFTVLGGAFIADRSTVFDDTTFDDFQASGSGWIVEVSGLVEAGGTVRATRLELTSDQAPVVGVTSIEVEGTVANLDPGVSFEIGTVTVLIDGLCGTTSFEGPISEGDEVDVDGLFVSGAPDEEVCALEVSFEDDFDDDENFEIEAIVTSVVSNASFVVGGIPVDASNASFQPASLEVVVGMRLEVEGNLDAGVLVADEVEQQSDFQIEAVVTEVGNGFFTLLGRTIWIDAATEIEPVLPAVTDFVDARVVENGAGGLTAIKIEVEPNLDADRVRIQGAVEAFDPVARTVTILGITIPTDSGTDCELADGSSVLCSTFFGSLLRVGDVLQATDEFGPFVTFDVADELEFED
jgi:hypothetical protein